MIIKNEKVSAADLAFMAEYEGKMKRAYSHLKGRLIPQVLFVRGYSKVSFVVMMGVISLVALKYLHCFSTPSG
jgi:hypothetical protein